MYLNLIFHRIAKNDKDILDDYEVTLEQFLNILDLIRDLSSSPHCHFKHFRYYFDDGDDSFISRALPNILKKELSNCVLAVTTNNIGKKDFITKSDIFSLHSQGVQIASHSVSHAALAYYKNDVIQPTTKGGRYQTSPFGHTKILSEQEVLYQLKESKKIITDIVGNVSEFVLPHGCYNKDVIRINQEYQLYDIISTCDNYLDNGYYLRPRILTRFNMSILEIKSLITSLKPIKDEQNIER